MNGLGRGSENNKKNSGIFTVETWGMVLVLFSFLCFVCLVTRNIIFGDIGVYAASFLLGVFGYTAYAFVLCFFYIGAVMVTGKKVSTPFKKTALILTLLISITLLVHAITSAHLDISSLPAYIKSCYEEGSKGALLATGGGALFAIFMFPIVKLLTFTGAYVVFSLAIFFSFYALFKIKGKSQKNLKIEGLKKYPYEFDFNSAEERVQESKKLLCRDDEFLLKTKKELKVEDKKRLDSMKILYPSGQKNSYFETQKSYQESFNKALDENALNITKPVKIVTDKTKEIKKPQDTADFFGKNKLDNYENKSLNLGSGGLFEKPQNQAFDAFEKPQNQAFDAFETPQNQIFDNLKTENNEVLDFKDDFYPFENIDLQTDFEDEKSGDLKPQNTQDELKEQFKESDDGAINPSNVYKAFTKNSDKQGTESVKETPKPRVRRQFYSPPPLHLFSDFSMDIDISKENFEENRAIIEETLSNFEIPAKVVNTIHGPTVTRYDIDIPYNIQSRKVLQYADDIAMRLRSKFGVRIEQNPGDGVLAIEVPNNEKAIVGLKNVLTSSNFTNTKKQSLAIGLGMDVTGSVIVGDVTKMPHLLVAGSTGSGKSVCLNTLIVSLITKYSPEDLRLILIDPKRVEFTIYSGLPHLVINEIIIDSSKTITTLNWAIEEMERRYILFNDKTVRDIDEYNENIDRAVEQKLAKIVIIVDELADLMTSNKKEIEDRIMKLTQKSRAAGIHLVLATQRPSVDIITGVIKTNLPSRIAFMVASAIDSRTILDESGAEHLLGNGDMLFKTGNMKMPMRLQGAFISMKEVRAVVNYIKENNEPIFDESAYDYINAPDKEIEIVQSGDESELEQVYIDALNTVIQAGQASISMIQRKYPVGYTKAGKIIDWMESKGYISQFEGSKSRQVLISQEMFDDLYGDNL